MNEDTHPAEFPDGDTFCENQFCENPGVRRVPVSVNRAGDQERVLCASCEAAYIWGVQHGKMIEKLRRRRLRRLAKRGRAKAPKHRKDQKWKT